MAIVAQPDYRNRQLQARVQINLQLAARLLARSRQRYRSTHQNQPEPLEAVRDSDPVGRLHHLPARWPLEGGSGR